MKRQANNSLVEKLRQMTARHNGKSEYPLSARAKVNYARSGSRIYPIKTCSSIAICSRMTRSCLRINIWFPTPTQTRVSNLRDNRVRANVNETTTEMMEMTTRHQTIINDHPERDRIVTVATKSRDAGVKRHRRKATMSRRVRKTRPNNSLGTCAEKRVIELMGELRTPNTFAIFTRSTNI